MVASAAAALASTQGLTYHIPYVPSSGHLSNSEVSQWACESSLGTKGLNSS